jgi:hypothetical protein
LLTSVVFAFYGASAGLGEWMGHGEWLGFLCTGLFFLLLSASIIAFQLVRSRRRLARLETDLQRSSREAEDRLTSLLDPREWTKKHPIPSAGVAAFAGFVAATQIGGSAEATGSEATASPSLMSLLVSAGVEILKNALVPVLSEKLAEQFQKDPPQAPPESAESPES